MTVLMRINDEAVDVVNSFVESKFISADSIDFSVNDNDDLDKIYHSIGHYYNGNGYHDVRGCLNCHVSKKLSYREADAEAKRVGGAPSVPKAMITRPVEDLVVGDLAFCHEMRPGVLNVVAIVEIDSSEDGEHFDITWRTTNSTHTFQSRYRAHEELNVYRVMSTAKHGIGERRPDDLNRSR